MPKSKKLSSKDMARAEDLELDIVAAVARMDKFLGILARRYGLQTPVQVDWKLGLIEQGGRDAD